MRSKLRRNKYRSIAMGFYALAMLTFAAVAFAHGAHLLSFGFLALGGIQNAEDGATPSGSFDATIIETGTPYIVDNFQTDNNTKKIQSSDSSGRIARQKVIPRDTTFSADFQMADVSTLAPRERETFAIDADKDGNVEPYMVEKVGRTFTSDDEYKCKVSGFACVAPLIYDTGTGQRPAPASVAHSSPITTLALGAYLPRDHTIGSYSATGLPTGLTISSSTGAISGTPSAAGTFSCVVKLTSTLMVDGVSKTRTGVVRFPWVIT